VARRSHDALRARDRGRTGIPLHDAPSDHRHHGLAPDRPPFDSLALRAWLRTHDGATLEAPTPDRPYWTVRRHGRYLAAGRSPTRAILNAQPLLSRP
jgi:hypothetical protein